MIGQKRGEAQIHYTDIQMKEKSCSSGMSMEGIEGKVSWVLKQLDTRRKPSQWRVQRNQKTELIKDIFQHAQVAQSI